MYDSSIKAVCAITGGNGYVGRCARKHFIERGWEVLELVRRPTRPTARPFVLGREISGAAFVGVHTLVHCAYDFSLTRWEEIQAVNIVGTGKLFQAARGAGVEKIICLSSISAFPGCRSLYGKAKLEIEKIAAAHGALVIRPGLVFGPNPGGFFGRLTRRVRRFPVVPLPGGGSQVRYLVHHEDLCGFMEKYASDPAPAGPGLLTAAHPQGWTFRELLAEIARHLQRRSRFVPLPWRAVWLLLKSAEACRLRLNSRSDGLIDLMDPVPAPDLSANAAAGLVCRPFRLN